MITLRLGRVDIWKIQRYGWIKKPLPDLKTKLIQALDACELNRENDMCDICVMNSVKDRMLSRRNFFKSARSSSWWA
jgi:hypothetical protein